jgi:hypothetical protein
MMTRGEAVVQIQEGLGFRSDLNDNIILKLKEAQRLFESGRTLPFFLKNEDQPLIIPIGDANVVLPSGFIKEVENESLRIIDPINNEKYFLEKFIDLDMMIRSLTGPSVPDGYPKAYMIRNTGITFLPKRNIETTATWSYYMQDVVLDNDVENGWLRYAPDAMIGKAGGLMVRSLGVSDAGMAKRLEHFQMLEAEGWAAIRAQTFDREEANFPRSMGTRL